MKRRYPSTFVTERPEETTGDFLLPALSEYRSHLVCRYHAMIAVI
ncbi:hypothetical protein SJ05684_c01150 [Sinorhizobium sojae CCBAU 05684]|uniref:Uncharacterized protein n=1 Tax=Sinorhizobium sojae CCBAU 05684 TaxID=716928 RepID=A0A249P706_9HYPH|nr:hypothetical protein SJ05684_c01150 [Sinorhizobium sojae CCBAU 05684]